MDHFGPGYKFGRVYRLEIGSDAETRIFDGFPSSDPNHAPAQIRFRIDQTPNGERSYAEIDLFGLSATSRTDLAARKFNTVRLTAGYVNAFGVLFSGEISNVTIGREGPESRVRLNCQSAAVSWGTAFVNQGFGANTPQIEIIRAVAATFGLPVEIHGDFSQLPRAIRGYVASGSSHFEMDRLARCFDFTWMVEGERIVIVKNGASRSSMKSHKFTPATGLIGSPELTDSGVNVTVLLNHLIRPWDLFEVEAETGTPAYSGIYVKPRYKHATGRYQATSIQHEGSFYEDLWQTRIRGVMPKDLALHPSAGQLIAALRESDFKSP